MRFLTSLIIVTLVGCGYADLETTSPTEVINNYKSSVTFLPIPYKGQCVRVNDSIWVENEGNHMDVYNNDDCDHDPSPKRDYCNDRAPGQVCWVGCKQLSIEGKNSSMILHVLSVCN